MITVKAISRFIYILEKVPDPAGQSTERQLMKLSIKEANQLIASVQEQIPLAKAAERESRKGELAAAQRALAEAQGRCKLLKRHIAELEA